MTNEEARLYYGEKCYSLIKKIYEFCKESDYVIYQHATDLESANNIIQKGFIVQSVEIDDIPTNILENMPIAFEYDDEGKKVAVLNKRETMIAQQKQEAIKMQCKAEEERFFETIMRDNRMNLQTKY